MTIYKVYNGSSNAIIREIWYCEDKEELESAIESYKRAYHPSGYGTFFHDILLCTDVQTQKHAGWSVKMSRFTSCD